jgi:hypothetical protein
LSEVIGSWKMIAISLARTAAHLVAARRDQVPALPQDLAGDDLSGRHRQQLQDRHRRDGLAAALTRRPRTRSWPRSIEMSTPSTACSQPSSVLKWVLRPLDFEQCHQSTLRGSSASRRPVADEIDRQHREEDGRAGEQRPVRRDVEVFLAVEQDPAPGRDVGRKAEAEEGEGGLGDDRRGHVDGAGHDHRPERVRKDVPHHLARHRGAERPRRFDELLLAQREELRPHQPRHRHPAEAADHQHDQDEDADLRPEGRLQPLAEQVDQDQQQRQLRQREEEVGQPHQRRIDRAARDSGDGADGHAHYHRHQHRRQAHRSEIRPP